MFKKTQLLPSASAAERSIMMAQMKSLAVAKLNTTHTLQTSNPYNFQRKGGGAMTNHHVTTVIQEEANGESDNLDDASDLLEEDSVSSCTTDSKEES